MPTVQVRGDVKLLRLVLGLLLLGPVVVGAVGAQTETSLTLTEPVTSTALAVAQTQGGDLVGTSASISVTVARNGSGHVFIDTRPLAGTDMQGSARMAARVASSLTGFATENHDFFYVVRSESPIISGPSAGSVMALATVVALEKAHHQPGDEPWNLTGDVMTTGTIAPDGSIGPVGGILEKARAAKQAGASLFAIPAGQGTYTPRSLTPGGVQQGEPVNVSAYCRDEVGIECREVGTLETLVELATGHRFVQPDLGEPPTTAVYNQTLGPLSDQLIDRGTRYEDVWDDLNASSISQEGQQAVRQAIDRAQEALGQAREHRANAEYYSAASRAFSASINGRHAELMLDFFERGRSLDQVSEAIEDARAEVRDAREAATGINVSGMQTLYTVGAAQERVSDAEQRIRSAQQNLNQTNVPEALFDAAWAVERSATVHWWLELGDAFGPGPPLPVGVDQLADEFIDLADEMLAYASQVQQTRPTQASQTLQSAKRDDARGFHAAALVQAAEAQVQAALALELQAGTPSEEKLETSRAEAAEAIQTARARGVEPVLPIALFEFGGAQEDNAVALEFYRTARVMAGISSVLTGEASPTESRFVGAFEASEAGGHGASLPGDAYRRVSVGWFTVGVFATLAVGTGMAALVKRGDDAP